MMDFDSVTRDWKWCGRYALDSIIEAGERLARTGTYRATLLICVAVALRLAIMPSRPPQPSAPIQRMILSKRPFHERQAASLSRLVLPSVLG